MKPPTPPAGLGPAFKKRSFVAKKSMELDFETLVKDVKPFLFRGEDAERESSFSLNYRIRYLN